MSAAGSLSTAEAQRWLQTQVLRDLRDSPELVAADRIAESKPRLVTYIDAYRLRLLEVLGNDYPVLKAAIGDDAFEKMGHGYIDAWPSTTPSVRWFGRHLSQHLRASGQPLVRVELAAFEWAQGEVFDAADADTAMLEELAVLPGEAWPGLRLQLHPSVRRLRLETDAPVLLRAHADGSSLSIDDVVHQPANWLLWRRGFDIHWRAVDVDEAAALDALAAGATFAGICETLLDWTAPQTVAMRAASLLKSWISEELIAGIVSDG